MNFICRRFGTLCSIFVSGLSKTNPTYTAYEDGTDSVPKNEECNIQNRAEVLNQEVNCYCHQNLKF
jgi:hypothetical protein